MKFSLPVDVAQKLASFIKDVVPTKSISLEGSGVLIEAKSNKIRLSAVGSDMMVRAVEEVVCVEEEGTVVVNAHMFSSSVNSIPKKDGDMLIRTDFIKKSVDIESQSESKTSNKKINHARSLPLLNPEMFRVFPSIDTSIFTKVDRLTFLDSLSSVMFTAYWRFYWCCFC
jgi:DNA polymerase III sliding clamp (beta) subunit (PCNA family)